MSTWRTPPTTPSTCSIPATGEHLFSIAGLPARRRCAGERRDELVFSSNRGENTIGVFAPGPEPGGAEDRRSACGPTAWPTIPRRRLVLAANVGDPAVRRVPHLSMVSLDRRRDDRASRRCRGRTRWAVYDPEAERFYVNIAEPGRDRRRRGRAGPTAIARSLRSPAAGPHGLDLDLETRRLFCACDAGRLITLDARSGKVLERPRAERHAGRRVLQRAAPAALCRGRRSRRHRRLRHHAHWRGSAASRPNVARTPSRFAPTGDRVYAFLPQRPSVRRSTT